MSAPASSTATPGEQPLIDAAALMQIHFSFAASRILAAALELELFAALASGEKTAAELVNATGCSARGLPMLLDALVPLGLLSKHDGRYKPTPVAEQYLAKGKPEYIGAGLLHVIRQSTESWNHLADIVRTGKPYEAIEEQKAAEEFFPGLVRWLHVSNSEPARRLAEALQPTVAKNPVVLDVACGSGIWGIRFAQADPTAQVIANDYPKVLETVTRAYVEKEGLSARYRYAPGDHQADADSARILRPDSARQYRSLRGRSRFARHLAEMLRAAEARGTSGDHRHDPQRRAHRASLRAHFCAQHAGQHQYRQHVHAAGVPQLARRSRIQRSHHGRCGLAFARDRGAEDRNGPAQVSRPAALKPVSVDFR